MEELETDEVLVYPENLGAPIEKKQSGDVNLLVLHKTDENQKCLDQIALDLCEMKNIMRGMWIKGMEDRIIQTIRPLFWKTTVLSVHFFFEPESSRFEVHVHASPLWFFNNKEREEKIKKLIQSIHGEDVCRVDFVYII